MPRYYCDYCDTYLTHDSPSVRKQHNAGYKHKANVRTYYQQFEEQQTQSLIDQRIKEHLGQTAAYQQVGAAYNQHLASLQAQRPRLPVLPTPVLPMTGTAPANAPLIPGMRPPIFLRPGTGAPERLQFYDYPTGPICQPRSHSWDHQMAGYGPASNMPSMMGPPSATSLPMQVNGVPRPPMMNPPTTVPGSTVAPNSNGSLSMITPPMYQTNPTAPTSGGFESFNMNAASSLPRTVASGTTAPSTAPTASQDGFTYSQTSEASP